MADIRISDEMVDLAFNEWTKARLKQCSVKSSLRSALLAALSSPDRGQEPVAWRMWEREDGGWWRTTSSEPEAEYYREAGYTVEPLFAHPAPQEPQEGDRALGYATRLLEAIAEKHYPDRVPEWKPFPDLFGVLTQIDNLTSGMVRAPQEGAGLVKALEWCEDKPGRWVSEGYMILEERPLPPSLEEALKSSTVYSWKADDWLYSDMRSERTLEAAKAAAQADYERRIVSALAASPRAEPQGRVIAKGLLSDDEASKAKLGKFGHHPDPAIDFCIEVESLQARLFDAKHGISKPGYASEPVANVSEDIRRAMMFRVGGDEGAVAAKAILRELEAEAIAALPASPAPTEEGRQPIELHIVFKDEGGPANLRFIEVETPDGKSVRAGTWLKREDGYAVLAMSVHPSDVRR